VGFEARSLSNLASANSPRTNSGRRLFVRPHPSFTNFSERGCLVRIVSSFLLAKSSASSSLVSGEDRGAFNTSPSIS
jgi:hypothetical protein